MTPHSVEPAAACATVPRGSDGAGRDASRPKAATRTPNPLRCCGALSDVSASPARAGLTALGVMPADPVVTLVVLLQVSVSLRCSFLSSCLLQTALCCQALNGVCSCEGSVR